MPQVGMTAEQVLVDLEAAESFGRRRLGDNPATWAEHVFQEADLSENGYLCPPEFAAVVAVLKHHLGMDASQRLKCGGRGLRFNFTYADTSLDGRIGKDEWLVFCNEIQASFGLQRCVRAAARYLGTRQAEARRRVKSVELFEGYNVEATLQLLTSCSNHGSPSLMEHVRSALQAQADPNAALTDPMHNGYSPLIWLAKAPPTMGSNQVAQAMQLLIQQRADPHRESGLMPFGRWQPLRFAAFMQNIDCLTVLLHHIDREDVLGCRFLWAAQENVEHIMLQELRKEFGDEMVGQIARRARYSMLATVLLQQYASPIAGGSLTPAGAAQLISGEFVSGNLTRGSKANPNGAGLEGRTALMDTVEAGDVRTVKSLLDNRADPNRKDSSGATALHFAAAALQVGVVRVLLDNGANPSEVDHCGFSPWMIVGEEFAHVRGNDGVYRVRTDGRLLGPDGREGKAEARRELLAMLKPRYSAEEILERLQAGWEEVLDPEFAGDEITLEKLAKRFRLSESLFFSSELADGHGAHEGRMERPDLLLPIASKMLELLRTEHLQGTQKVLTRYLLQATMGPCSVTACAHVRTPWKTKDNRHSYRDSLRTVAEDMLGKFARECLRMREIIRVKAGFEPKGACARLSRLAEDEVVIPAAWMEDSHEDCAFWRQVQERQKLRYDPPWALEVDGSPGRAFLALLRLEAVGDLEECAELSQVYHASMSEFFARGYVQYANLCNLGFQDKLKHIALRCAVREGLNVDPPDKPVPHKQLKRVMEKCAQARAELGRDMHWAGRSKEYGYHSHAFYILDAVRLSFTCKGKTTEEQVHGCMALLEEFRSCTVEKDGLCVLRVKSGFAPGVGGAGGYADVKLLVYADVGVHKAFDGSEIPLRIVGEVQLILEGYMKVKTKMHLVYEVHRGSFDRDDSTRARTE